MTYKQITSGLIKAAKAKESPYDIVHLRISNKLCDVVWLRECSRRGEKGSFLKLNEPGVGGWSVYTKLTEAEKFVFWEATRRINEGMPKAIEKAAERTRELAKKEWYKILERHIPILLKKSPR